MKSFTTFDGKCFKSNVLRPNVGKVMYNLIGLTGEKRKPK